MKTIKNKESTKALLIDAVGQAIAELGFAKLGVNAVARQAGVDKVLIYRYFGGLDGLIKCYAESTSFWPDIEEILGNEEQRSALKKLEYSSAIASVFQRYSSALRKRPLTVEILAWETIERNGITEQLEQSREAMALQLAQELKELSLPEADWPAITSVLSAAIHYLAIRARKINHYNGLPLQEQASWDRLIASFKPLLSGLAEKHIDSE